MNILDEIFKRNLDERRGRIHLFPGNWVFEPTEAQLNRSGYTHTSVDAMGRKIYCLNQDGVWCNNPEKVAGYPKDTGREQWYLPAYVCRKCEHHRKGKRRGVPRYPTCAWRARKNAEAEAEDDTRQAVADAITLASEIIGS